MTPNQVLVVLVAITGATLFNSTIVGAQEYVLEVPGDPSTRSQATIVRNELVIVDAKGQRFRYTPRPEHNTPAGDFIGLYCAEAGRYLRWPESGVGAMHVGTLEGNRVSWRKSLMEIRPVGVVNRRVPLPDPRNAVGNADPFGGGRRAVVLGNQRADITNIAALPIRDSMFVAHVDEGGHLQVYVGEEGRWKNRRLEFRDRLPTGATLALASEPRSEMPKIYFVSDRGQMSEITSDLRIRTLPGGGSTRFPPGGPVALVQRRGETWLASVDVGGRLLAINPGVPTFEEVERQPDLFVPGAQVRLLATDSGYEVFLVDRRGNLVRYEGRPGRWTRPHRIAHNLVSGGHLDVGQTDDNGARARTVIAVDNAGRLHTWEELGSGWEEDVPGDVRLAPGSPTSLATFRNNLSITAIALDGDWCVWHRRSGLWSRQTIAQGFHPGSSVLLEITGPYSFAIDPMGRLVAARYWNSGWECSLCLPTVNFGPRLVRRTVVPNEPLPPANVEFENTHTEEIVVKLFGGPSAIPTELTIQPRKSATQPIERDAGSTMEEVYLVPGPGGELVEEVHQHRLPAKQIYTAVVYASRVTSVYFDRTKNKSNIPDESSTSLVSLGVFPIVSGESLRDGDRIDAYREATARRNPGAAAHFGPP